MTHSNDDQTRHLICPKDETTHPEQLQIQDKDREKPESFLKTRFDLYDVLPVGCVTIGEKGFISGANLAFANFVGSSRESLIYERLNRLIIKEDRGVYLLFQKRLFRTGKSSCELRLKTADFPSFWVCLRGMISSGGKSGKPVGVIMVMDINKYKQEEERLRGSRDNLSRILDNSPVVMYSKDLTGKYTIINKKFEELSGLTRNEVIHKTDFELFPKSVAMQSTENDRQVIERAVPLETEEIAPVLGKMRTFLSAKYPLMDSHDKIYGICGFSMDIEKRKCVENALKASLKEKEILLKEIHHRVKNNMQVISSLLNLQMMSNKDEQVKKVLMDCQGRIQTMASVHQMLYMSARQSVIDCQAYLSKLTNNMLQSYHIGRHRIQLTVDAGGLSLGIQQALVLGLIINELLSNALKYGFPENRHGRITILLGMRERDIAELVFSDNGIGIPKDMDWRNAKRLGLNLIVLLVENQLGGTISLDREKGTCFTIRFSLEHIKH